MEIILLKKEELKKITIAQINREGYTLLLEQPEKDLITLIR